MSNEPSRSKLSQIPGEPPSSDNVDITERELNIDWIMGDEPVTREFVYDIVLVLGSAHQGEEIMH